MHWARFAPELSATVTMVRSWIMNGSRLPGALDELHEAPALVLGHGPGLHEADHVTDLALVLLVVDLELLPPPHVAAHGGVSHEPLDGDDHRLLHAIAHHLAGADLSAIAFRRHGFRGARPSAARAFLLLEHREQARHLAAALADLDRVVQLLHRVAEAQVEQLLAQLRDAMADLVRPHLPDRAGLHAGRHGHSPPSSRRSTKRVLIGSLDAPRSNASRASWRVMPSISNSTRPGRTTATQNSGAPLPLPIRVSAGFFVTGLSGNTRIHTLPPRLIVRVMATRAASIWRLVTHAGCVACSPNSPNAMLEPR